MMNITFASFPFLSSPTNSYIDEHFLCYQSQFSLTHIAIPMNITCATNPFLFSLTDSYIDEHFLC